MKNIKFKLFTAFLLAFAFILNISCTNLINKNEESGTFITISMGEESRMVMPSVSAESLTNIVLYKDSVEDKNKLSSWDTFDEMEAAKIPMETGACTLILKAALGTLEVQDSKDVTIVEGANNVSFSFTASNNVVTTEEGKGSVKINLSYEGSGTVSQGVFNIKTSDNTYSGKLESSDNNKLVFTASEIPAPGYYTFEVQAKVGEKFAAYKGSVWVAKGLTSVGDFTCELTTGALLKTTKVTVIDSFNNTTVEKTLCPGANFTQDSIIDDVYDAWPTYDGYVFSGFNDANGKEVLYVPSEDSTLYVNWLEAVTVTYKDSSDDSVIGTGILPKGRSCYLIEPSWDTTRFYYDYYYSTSARNHLDFPTKTGYIFDGWYKEQTCENRTSSSEWNWYLNHFDITEDLTLYAKWREGAVISFNSNGGSEVSSVTLDIGSVFGITSDDTRYYLSKKNGNYFSYIEDVTIPTKENQLFAGWYTDSSCTTSALYKEFTLTKDGITLYAKWGTPRVLTFISDGSTVKTVTVADGDSIYIDQYLPQYTGYTVPTTYVRNPTTYTDYITFATPTKDGYAFVNWYTDEDCTTLASSTFTVNNDMNIYAKWGKSHTVTFNSMGGSEIDALTAATGATVYLNDYEPTYRGYIFEGWYTDDNCTSQVSYSYTMPDSDVTLYAKWTAGVVISFDTAGGSTVDPVTVRTGSSVFLYKDSEKYNLSTDDGWFNITIPTKEGYTFGGWYKDAEFKESAEGGGSNSFTVSKDITLYGKWLESASLVIMNGDSVYKTITAAKNEDTMYQVGVYTTLTQSQSYFIIGTASGSTYQEVYLPSNGNKIAEGLYTDSACTERLPAYPNTFQITENSKTVYIKWVDPCVITLHMNNDTITLNVPAQEGYDLSVGEGTDSGTKCTYAQMRNLQTGSGFYIQHSYIEAPEGKTLLGFYTDSSYSEGSAVNPYSVNVNGNMDLYAKYTDTCTVTYELNGGTFSYTPGFTQIALGSSFYVCSEENWTYCETTELQKVNVSFREPTKTGYTFAGWYLDESLKTPVPTGILDNYGYGTCSGTPYTVTGNITLYAKWE